MGIAIYVTMGDAEEYASLVGANELKSLWKPIIEDHGLHLLDYVVNAGLEVDSEFYADLLSELSSLCSELQKRLKEQEVVENPIFRCKRAIRILKENNPSKRGSARIYFG